MQNSLVIQRVLGKIGASLFQLNLPNIFFGLILFFSATQLGFHFWPLSTLVYGIRIDYLSPTLYFLDFLIILDLILSPHLRSTIQHLQPLFPILLTNLLYSHNPLATLSWSLHLILYLFFISTTHHLRPTISHILTLALLFQFTLSLTQVYLGHLVGGLMYYLGERAVAVGSPGIALGTFMDQVVLRAYGTFGHPNVLAGWAVVALLILIKFYKQKNKLLFPLLLTTLIVLLTQSRSAALALFALIIPPYLIKNFRLRIIYFVFLLSTIYYLPSTLIPPRSDLSLSQRLDLQGLSLQVISQYPIFGTGAQASISTYPSVSPTNRLLQPDHNSFTLFLSWFGLFGVLAILFSLRSTIYDIRSLFPLLPLLLLDHYFLTSPQGLFIALLYLNAVNYSHD
jgi:hypothetical protein